jgi:hypothetical protein
MPAALPSIVRCLILKNRQVSTANDVLTCDGRRR